MTYDVMKSLAEMLSAPVMADKALDFTELKKLADGLFAKGVTYEVSRTPYGKQIIVYDDKHTRIWDAVIGIGTYGAMDGLIEIMGTIVQNDDDSVEGYLTADEILARV